MSRNLIYDLKLAAGAPVAALRRRRDDHAPDTAQGMLELRGHSKAARELMAMKAIDPAFLHRADLDGDSVVVDVGAYRGDGAAQIHDLYGCRVYAFEPNPAAFAAMEERFADVAEVVPVPYGLGGADATLSLELAGPGSSLHGLVDDDRSASAVEVRVRDVTAALDELGLDRIDFLKVNIEGAEFDLFDRIIGAGLLPDVRYVLIQFHEWHPRAHRRRWRIRRELKRTHDLVWDYPWIFELWCARSQPHPPPLELTPELQAAVIAKLMARREAQEVPDAPET
ncbi:MAG: FkbM family methyltransferase [Actinobacteria bacterium]|nr:FkbM family methyltransferase [Actinomycetota bacterium]